MIGEAPTFGLRRGRLLYLCGDGYRAALFHLGALTRLNELGLLAGIETIYGVSGSGILGALLATRVPWPLQGAFRDWPETVAEPMREISCRHVRGRSLRRSSTPSAPTAIEQERYARELAGQLRGGGAPRLVLGAAGAALGQISGGRSDGGEDVRWELARPPASAEPGRDPLAAVVAAIRADLTPLGEGPRVLLENRGYLFADRALREAPQRTPGLEPLPPLPPHRNPDEGRRTQPQLRRGRRSRIALRVPRPRWNAEAGLSAARAAELLERHRPFVQLDSLESYLPDPVETIAELALGSRCNTLHRADGETIASTLPRQGVARLDLRYLGETVYADGRPVCEDDYLDEAGGSHASDALTMRRARGLESVVYGRARCAGRWLWLQYWFFYYYNDKGLLKVGRHEGDWEMIQLRLSASGRPDAVTYARHRGGERARWDEVERQPTADGEAPVVYCARGSHASLLRPGTRSAPSAPDHNDGLGPRLRPRLVALEDELPGWARWPGRWGATRRREAFEGDSPRGPAFDPRWADPGGFHRDAAPIGEDRAEDAPPPPTPRFEARLDDGRAVLSYRFPERGSGQARPGRIVAAAVGGWEGEGTATECFLVEGRSGSCALPAGGEVAPTAIRACVVSELGTPGLTVTVPIP